MRPGTRKISLPTQEGHSGGPLFNALRSSIFSASTFFVSSSLLRAELGSVELRHLPPHDGKLFARGICFTHWSSWSVRTTCRHQQSSAAAIDQVVAHTHVLPPQIDMEVGPTPLAAFCEKSKLASFSSEVELHGALLHAYA